MPILCAPTTGFSRAVVAIRRPGASAHFCALVQNLHNASIWLT
jgi:hypothetical protein